MNQTFRRLAWRLGRAIYFKARGEPANDDVTRNGEAYVQRCVLAAVRPDERLAVLDIGANQGDWTLPLLAALPPELRSGERAEIHLFEPVAKTRHKLEARISDQIATGSLRIHAAALSDRSGRARMQVVGETAGRNSLVASELDVLDVLDVETTSLTEFFARSGIARAQLVKADAEGHDAAILRGARDLLAAGRIDVFQFEYNHAWVFARAFLKDVFDLVHGLPYVVARVRPHCVEVLPAWHPELEHFIHANFLLIREPALAWFDAHIGRFDVSNTYA